LTVNSATCQTKDTTVSYFKNRPGFLPQKVLTADSADFVRIVYPDSSANLYNILEYYSNGIKKFIGKIEQRPNGNYTPKIVGDCIGFFPNGKKKYTAHYVDHKILGLEYFFYPTGHIYAVKKWVYNNTLYNDGLYWECYDKDANKICEDGSGVWAMYKDDFSDVIFSGKVKKGLMSGRWQGYDILGDTIKYIGNYDEGALISGIGYDKNGTAYHFANMNVETQYKRGNVFTFLDDLNWHLILPKDANGKKMNIDTVHISFIIEKDGHLSELKVIGNVNPQLQIALNNAVKKCGEWAPSKYYGISYRSWFITSLKVKANFNGIITFKKIDFEGNIIDSIKKTSADSAQPN
jgi:hypothetical protein